ncbi:hypothetical protein M8C21_004223 [Ambrosia artemisiifolia]|uniref:Nucleolus and neural progenitor protein-like N-terminal domain-containing protein n=1 Tax=Ambrosia artemisiifolia TaxID=4212 RepID=A0AAD5BPP9_AMBAR|nr:hypothetical protein M8C21_004223 [Ambrosia artemisiifolia]
MDAQGETIEARLQSFLGQLQSELGVLDRIIHKNKNQHRRSSYFQYLLKVRRDCKLLQSTNLLEIVNSSFIVINGNRPRQKVQLLESLKRRKCDSGKHNFLERLQGAARLLSQMVEPMLKAAIYYLTLSQYSTRLPPCLESNNPLNLTKKELRHFTPLLIHSVYREYYPTNEQAVYLECVWETDKFVLFEKQIEPDNTNPETINDAVVCQASSTLEYESIETILGVNKPADVTVDKTCEEDPATMRTDNLSSIEGNSNDDCKQVEGEDDVKDQSGVLEPSMKNSEQEQTTCSSFLANQDIPKPKPKKVAFISVKKPEASKANDTGLLRKLSDDKGKENPLIFLGQ